MFVISFGDSFGTNTKTTGLGFNINLLVFFWFEAEKLLQLLRFASPTMFLWNPLYPELVVLLACQKKKQQLKSLTSWWLNKAIAEFHWNLWVPFYLRWKPSAVKKGNQKKKSCNLRIYFGFLGQAQITRIRLSWA